MMRLEGGRYIVLNGFQDGKMYITDPGYSDNIAQADREKVMAAWTGEVILFTRRFELEKEEARFGFKWFLPVVAKYGKYLRNVLVMSLFLQLLGLAAPFFMQVIIDKVLVHRSASTLDILIIGMMISAIFTNWLQALRSYLFTNITSKMDVALSSRLFRIITALPVKYFSRWQVGDVVSRAGELENLRNFMTGSALTIVLDIVFALVYLGVCLLYTSDAADE